MDSEFDTLIINAQIGTASECFPGDIAIKDGKIFAIAPSLKGLKAKNTIDAEGAYVTPGGVDGHTHIDQENTPGGQDYPYRGSDGFESGSRSSVAGGTTTFIAFAMQHKHRPEHSLADVIGHYHDLANGNSYADYAFHLIITDPSKERLAEFSNLIPKFGISSIKLYMTYERLALSDYEILQTIGTARKNGITPMIHAENIDIISFFSEELERLDLVDPYSHARSRPALAEHEATNRAIVLSEVLNVPILFVHISSPGSVERIHQAQGKGLPIYAETCPQYLLLTDAGLQAPNYEGAKCVCSPPLRPSKEDLDGLWNGLRNGTFTMVSSDHCPFRMDEELGKPIAIKDSGKPGGDWRLIPNGIPGIETRVPLLFTFGVCTGRLSIERFVQLTSTNTAKLYGMYPKKGSIVPGADADLVIWYPQGKFKKPLSNEMLHHNCDYTAFEGMEMLNWPRYTLLRGEVVWDDEKGVVTGKKGYGEYIPRETSWYTRNQVQFDDITRDAWKNEWRPAYVKEPLV
ncbi:uncharacterized protein V1516DRAFT_670583 [Lipomyces oligophaga]|uniref:uncharacterized protein n=1 Tax=Lipomyces oligophaga TaxID=45792 RepID=UPI0034CE8BC5